MEETKIIKSVAKAMKILIELSEHEKPISLEKISNDCELNKSTCVHILDTLKESGFVDHVSRARGYQIKPFCFELAKSGLFHDELIHLCQPVMRWLYEKTNETVLLTILYKGRKLIIHYLTGKRKLSADGSELVVGNQNFYKTGTARALLASISFDREQFQEIYKTLGLPEEGVWPEVTDYESLMVELKKIRDQGYAKVPDPEFSGFGYGSVLYDKNKPIASLGIATMDALEDDSYIIKNLKIAAQEINRRLDFSTLT